MSIPFIQCLRPNGRRVPAEFDSDPITEAKAQEVIEFGFRFTVEKLPGNLVALCVENDEEDIATRVVQEGPKISDAVKNLVESAHRVVVGDS